MEKNNEFKEIIFEWLRKIHPIAWISLSMHICIITAIYLTSNPRSPETASRFYYLFLFGMSCTVLQPWIFCARYFKVVGRNTHSDVQNGCIGILVFMIVFTFIVGNKACIMVRDYNYDLDSGWSYINLNAMVIFLNACMALYTMWFTFEQASTTFDEEKLMSRLYMAQNKYFKYH